MSVENSFEQDFFNDRANYGIPLTEETVQNIANLSDVEESAKTIGEALAEKLTREEIETFCDLVLEGYSYRKSLTEKDDAELNEALDVTAEMFEDAREKLLQNDPEREFL